MRLKLALLLLMLAAPLRAGIVLEASTEVRSAVVYATLIVIIVFLPIFFLGGVAGTFFQPLAIAYVLAIAASLLVALVVTTAAWRFSLHLGFTLEDRSAQ